MGLNRELRTLNNNILTDKQERQLERQEKRQQQQLKADLKDFLAYHFKNYLQKNYVVYKHKFFTNEFKNDLQKEAIKQLSFYNNNDFILNNFDSFYILEAKKQINQFEIFNTPQQASPTKKQQQKSNPLLLPFLIVFHFVNILNVCLAGFSSTNKKRF